jgi:hypothetical protein
VAAIELSTAGLLAVVFIDVNVSVIDPLSRACAAVCNEARALLTVPRAEILA